MSQSKSTIKWKLAPLRSLDDFLLAGARFQVPRIDDSGKWGNRITNNLLYYQTNYFLMAIILFFIIGVIHPVFIVCGLLIPVSIYFLEINLVSGVLLLVIGYYMLGSLYVTFLTLLITLFAIFIHASLRLRNVKNKLTNHFEALGGYETPVGILFKKWNIEIESLLKVEKNQLKK